MDDTIYKRWRDTKLQSYPRKADDVLVEVAGLNTISIAEKSAIYSSCLRANMAIYKCRDTTVSREAVKAFAENFGLRRIDHHLCANADGVSELSVAENKSGLRAGYVPYSNRSLSWHTDGYYNEPARRIRAVVLHCARPAASGGENALLDAEIAYIKLRDEEPAFITAFEHPQCMTIPANMDAGGEVRAAVTGPVLFRGADGHLQMRFSARKRNIKWRDDSVTNEARACLAELLANKDGPVLRYRLKAGEGLIANNILHNRTAFENDSSNGRLLYRARFFDRIDPG